MSSEALVSRSDDLAPPLISKKAAAAGKWIPRRKDLRYPIPGRLNLLLSSSQMVAALVILTEASRVKSPYL